MLKPVIIALLAIVAYFYFQPKEQIELTPVLETKYGKVQGIVGKSRDGREFWEYLGIPYGKAERFADPQRITKWTSETLDATKPGPDCFQLDFRTGETNGKEECLFLNIHRPSKLKENKSLLPVAVWIHGGMFHTGSGRMYHPNYFMDHDLCLVTLNYRLGPFGFLSTGDNIIRGNMGLKDQALALKFIKENIKAFGCDDESITIFGESAGAASVHHHLFSPLSKGLFHRAISQSGAILNPWAVKTNHKKQAKRFAQRLNCPVTSSREMADCLKSLSPEAIINANKDIISSIRDPITVFTPTIEAVDDDHAFLATHPIELLRKGTYNKVPWIAGVLSHEGLLSTAPLIAESRLTELHNLWNEHLPHMIWHDGNLSKDTTDRIRKFYVGDNKVDDINSLNNLTHIFTDTIFSIGIEKSAKLQAKHSPVYLYYYSYKGEFSLTDYMLALKGNLPSMVELIYYYSSRWLQKKIFGVEFHHYGSCHFDEVPMLFHIPMVGRPITRAHSDYEMSKELVKTWATFASGDFNNMVFKGKTWKPLDLSVNPIKYFHLDLDSQGHIPSPLEERIQFWESVTL